MTRIEEMTEPQRQSWITLLADGAVFIWFLRRMLSGRNLTDLPPGELLATFAVVIGWTIVAHIVIAVIFETRRKDSSPQSDERDADIARRGDKTGYYVLCVFVSIFIVTFLIENAAGKDYQGPVSVVSPTAIFFWLICALYCADLAKQITKLRHYHG